MGDQFHYPQQWQDPPGSSDGGYGTRPPAYAPQGGADPYRQPAVGGYAGDGGGPGAYRPQRLPQHPPRAAHPEYFIPYQGDAWTGARSPRNAPHRQGGNVMHTVGVSIFLLFLMAGSVACAYYVLSCYGFY